MSEEPPLDKKAINLIHVITTMTQAGKKVGAWAEPLKLILMLLFLFPYDLAQHVCAPHAAAVPPPLTSRPRLHEPALQVAGTLVLAAAMCT